MEFNMEPIIITMVICINNGLNQESEFQEFLDKRDKDGWRLLDACWRPYNGFNEYRLRYEKKRPIV